MIGGMRREGDIVRCSNDTQPVCPVCWFLGVLVFFFNACDVYLMLFGNVQCRC